MSTVTEIPTDAPASAAATALLWPEQLDVFGVRIAPTTYEEATDVIIDAAQRRERRLVSCYAVHALITFCEDPELRALSNDFDMITPDGQPVRWALNLLHGAQLAERVYGPHLMLHLCRRAAQDGVPVYLYGGSPVVAAELPQRLNDMLPDLQIAGSESPPFRQLTPEEDQQVIERINASGAGLVFIGLGCPKQDQFAHAHRNSINAVQVCVGAAFDFHAGAKSTAPAWMQRRGLEWLYRLIQEPRRLWHRYLVTNSSFLLRLAGALLNIPNVLRQRSHRRRQTH